MEQLNVEFITADGYSEQELLLEETDVTESHEDFVWEETDVLLKANDKANAGLEAAFAALGSECKKFKIATIGNWPEVKTEMVNRCIKIPFNGKACTKIPKVYRRTCKKTVFAEICYPSNIGDSIKTDIEKCAIGAAVASVAAAIASGATGALPVFGMAFKACLEAKIGDKAKQIKFAVRSSKECSDWKPV